MLASELDVSLAAEKTEESAAVLSYLGIQIDSTKEMCILLTDKVVELKWLIQQVCE